MSSRRRRASKRKEPDDDEDAAHAHSIPTTRPATNGGAVVNDTSVADSSNTSGDERPSQTYSPASGGPSSMLLSNGTHANGARSIQAFQATEAALGRGLKEHLAEIENLLVSCDVMRSTVTRELDRINHEVNQLRRSAHDRLTELDPDLVVDSASTRERRYQRHWSVGDHIAFGSGKVFYSRESRLTELLLIKDFQTIYNIFVSVLPLLFISICADEYYQTGTPINFAVLTSAFAKIDVVWVSWIILFSYAMIGYRWKYAYKVMPLWLMISLYVLYQAGFALFAGWVTLRYQLPTASGMIVMCEQSRMSMKLHSYFRAYMCGPPEGRAKPSHDAAIHMLPTKQSGRGEAGFSHFIYFIFCPTLLYRTQYPRTPYVRWTRVFVHFSECSFIILYLYVLFQKFLFPVIRSPPEPREDSLKLFLLMSFNCMLPSMVVFIFGFFGVLHCWLNLWAELLQFADREFYKDWWNSTSFNEFYRKWNGVVYDWLYTYCYLDSVVFFERYFSKPAARRVAAVLVIEASAVVHEYILACALGYCYPMLLVMFGGPGLLFTQIGGGKDVKGKNVFVWCMLLIGTGFLIACYSREYYIRQYFVKHPGQLHAARFWKEFITPYSLQTLFGFEPL
ncbi:hypothetical protein SeMB42_g02761 [Synchytrium endobioticum]|uniref:O-acyltransferase n=1 Tax=Synchytrium endobioticum TaxID=286115 RepID=A0A507DCG1_9FUNG|nr:hypothetical protein SeLEV6574_g04506 [Synchytrium endobioticum]TPX49047.1 hypothetical protein SeMB42_g02761 [Synchytrium endobioticum]